MKWIGPARKHEVYALRLLLPKTALFNRTLDGCGARGQHAIQCDLTADCRTEALDGCVRDLVLGLAREHQANQDTQPLGLQSNVALRQ